MFSGFIYGTEKMLTQELHNRRIQIQPALHAIAGSFLMSCGDSDTAVSFAEGRAQLFTPHFHIIMWQVSFLTQAVAEVCLSKYLFFCALLHQDLSLANHGVRHSGLSKEMLLHLHGAKCWFSQFVPTKHLNFYLTGNSGGSDECDRLLTGISVNHMFMYQ